MMKTKLLLLLLLSVCAPSVAGDYDHAVFRAAADAQDKGRRSGQCQLHKREMSKKTVPVVFGLNGVSKEDKVPADTRVRFFPHAAEYSASDQAGQKSAPKTAAVYVCPDCQAAEKKWKQEHPQ